MNDDRPYFPLKEFLFFLLTGILIVVLYSDRADAQPPKNFSQAKKVAMQLWSDKQVDVYCNMTYDSKGIMSDGTHVSWEHITPASWLYSNLPCGQGNHPKKRQYCEKVSPEFNRREGDLHNLAPANLAANIARQNYPYAGGLEGKYLFKKCQIKIDKASKVAEPPDEFKGIAARATLYMTSKYNILLTSEQLELYNKWNDMYPPTEWELGKIEQINQIEEAP